MTDPIPLSPQRPEAVRIRPARAADAALLKAWRDEPSVGRFQPLGQATVAQLRAELLQQDPLDLARGRGGKFQWIIEADKRPAGWMTLVVANWEHGLAELGYALSTPYQGRGIVPRALDVLVSVLFRETRIERIEARCAVENRASRRVLESAGFREEGLLRGYFRLGGHRVDNLLFALLRADWDSDARVPVPAANQST